MPETIMVVEDDNPTFQLLRNVISGLGYEVVHANTGDKALQLATELSPALIIMDMRLPKMDGWQATSQLASQANTSHIPVLAVSVTVDPQDEDKARAAGCVDYMSKPFDISDLRERIRRYALA